jgi:alpha-beta hydrolase superfamily lysophospholipase
VTTKPRSEWNTGTGLAGYFWPADQPRANLLLQHGLGEYAIRYETQYSQLVPKLQRLGFNVYAIDLPGHGNSAGPRAVVDLNRAVDQHLAARRLIPTDVPLVLFGHSLGGLLTAGSVVTDPDGIAAAVIASSALQGKVNAVQRKLAGLLVKLNPTGRAPVKIGDARTLTRDQDLVQIILHDPMMFHGQPRVLSAATVIDVSDLVWQNASNFTVPTLIMHGTADLSTPYQQSQRLYEAIPASDKTLKIYPDATHELLNDIIHEQVERDLFDWLETQL